MKMKPDNEKQAIEEMAKIAFPFLDIVKPEFYDTAIHGNIHVIKPIENLYNAGYRKQSVGYWIYDPDGMDWWLGAWICSECGCKNDNLPGQKDIKPLQWAGAKFCPECGVKMIGARMKGGE